MNVLIVESAAKAKTLGRYLGPDWTVLATGGHVQTLPYDRERHGPDAKNAYWANAAGSLPDPPWVWTMHGEEALKRILAEADGAKEPTFWIATDPDREGEFIAWCLERLLKGHGQTHRVSFQEVTEEAVREAIRRPRDVDAGMVESALLRRFLDRLVGYRTSRLARGVIPGGSTSMGRVQTPTLGFVVERELEREAHVPIPYFEVKARSGGVELRVRFHEPGDADAWKNEAGRTIPTRTFDEALATEAERALRHAGQVEVREATRGSRSSSARPPFSTDALLQAAGSRFGWSPKKTSALASILYEAGHITYIRSDSTRLAASAVERARETIAKAFGVDHLGKRGSTAPSLAGSGPVQDAHEAIRPTRVEIQDVPVDDADARKLYRLVRAHTLASQMAPSRYETAKIQAAVDGLDRPLAGNVSWRTFPGWEAAYAEFRAEPATAPPALSLEAGAVWVFDPDSENALNPVLVEDETQPPPRYRPHALIRAMKEAGIGRPSTYSKTVEKLEERRYVQIVERALAPTPRGRAAWLEVAPLYVRNEEDTELFSPEFTALMEAQLDAVAQGEEDAPETWERWRDEIRALHETAQERRREGKVTPRSRERLQRLLKNASEDVARPTNLAALSEKEAKGWIERLRKAGVVEAPSAAQLSYIESLVEEMDLEPADAAGAIGLVELSEIRSSAQASELIEELSRLRDERRPPSRKQIALIERLREEVGMAESEAAALVEEPRLEALTGGRQGSASALIDALREVVESRPNEGS